MNDFSYVAPPEDGLRLAMAQARGRRYRTAGVSTTTVAAAFAVLAAIAGGSGTQSLVEQPAPEQPAVTQLVPGPNHVQPGTRNAPGTAGATLLGVTGTGPSLGAPAGQQVAARGTSSTQQDPSSRAAGKTYAAGPITAGNTVYVPSPQCHVTNDGSANATTLCPSSYVYGPYDPPTPYRFQFYGDVCSTEAGFTALHFAGRNEVDMVVYRGKTEVWRWSRWHRDNGSAHTLDIPTENCATWTFDWTAVDAAGAKLPKGNYSLKVSFLAAELAATPTSAYTFQIT